MTTAIGTAVCRTCKAPTLPGDWGLCRACDAPEFASGVTIAPPVAGCSNCGGFGVLEAPGSKERIVECSACTSDVDLTARARLAGVPEFAVSLPALSLSGVVAQVLGSCDVEHPSCYLWGETEAGKTTRAARGLKAWLRGRVRPARFVSLASLRRELGQAIDGEGEDPIAPALEAECLVLDDLGKERITPHVWDSLWDVVNERYNRAPDLVTVFTSNCSLPELATRIESGTAPGKREMPRGWALEFTRRIRDIVQGRIVRLTYEEHGGDRCRA